MTFSTLTIYIYIYTHIYIYIYRSSCDLIKLSHVLLYCVTSMVTKISGSRPTGSTRQGSSRTSHRRLRRPRMAATTSMTHLWMCSALDPSLCRSLADVAGQQQSNLWQSGALLRTGHRHHLRRSYGQGAPNNQHSFSMKATSPLRRRYSYDVSDHQARLHCCPPSR